MIGSANNVRLHVLLFSIYISTTSLKMLHSIQVPLNCKFVILTASTSHRSRKYSITTQSTRIANLESEILSGLDSTSSVSTLRSCAIPALLDMATGDDDAMHRTISSVCSALIRFCKYHRGSTHEETQSTTPRRDRKNKISRTLSYARKFLPMFLQTQQNEHGEHSELRELHLVAPSRHAAEILLKVCASIRGREDAEESHDEDKKNETNVETPRTRAAAVLKKMRGSGGSS
mgnify:CR=1 FL=1